MEQASWSPAGPASSTVAPVGIVVTTPQMRIEVAAYVDVGCARCVSPCLGPLHAEVLPWQGGVC